MKHNYLLHIGLLMAMLLLPMAAWGQTTLDISTGTITFESGGYTQENGSSGSDQNGYIITQTETMTSNIIFVKGGTYNITLDGVNIRAISSNRDTYSAFDLRSSSTVNLTLKGNNTLEAASSRDNNPGYRYAALSVPKDNTLTITDQSTGTLSAKGGMYIDSRNTTVYGAGIGGSQHYYWGVDAGTIIINGGVIDAYGNSYAQDIGSGGTVSINGGVVRAGNSRLEGSVQKNNCLVFLGNAGTVYGNCVLKHDYTNNRNVTIGAETSLTINADVTLTNTGTITIEEGGTLINNGTFTGNKIRPSLSLSESSGSTSYRGNNLTFTYTYNGDGNISVKSSNENVIKASVNAGTKTVTVSPVGGGSATVTVSAAQSDVYDVVNQDYMVTVDKVTLTKDNFTFTAPSNLVYTGQALTIDNPVTTELTTGIITEKYYKDGTGEGLTQVVDAGTYTVKIDVAESDNNKSATAITGGSENAWTFTVDKATLKNTDFKFSAPADLVYTGQALTIDKPVTTALTIGAITEKYYKDGMGEGLTQVVDAGTYTVKIDVAESDNNKSATAITGGSESVWTFTVDKATLKNTDFTFTAPSNLVYTGQALTIDKSVTTTLTTGTITEKYYKNGTGEGLMQVVDAGIYTVKIDVAGSDNYKLATAITGEGESAWTFTVDKATLKNTDFTFTAPTDLVYTGQALTIDKPVTTALTTGTITEKYYKDGTGEGLMQVVDAGIYTVKIDVEGSDNYKLATAITGEGESVWTFTVDKATLKNTDFTFTAPTDLVYTGQALTIDKSVTTALTTGEITEKYYKDGTGDGLTQVIDAGTYTVKIDVAESDNYKLATAITGEGESVWTFTVDKATLKNTDFTFTAPTDLVYTGQALTIDKSVTTTLTTGEITEKYYKDGTGEGLMQVIDAGTYTVKISVAESDNYNEVTDDMTDDSWTFAITPKEITVTPDADQVFFNEGKDATITYTHADFADADKEDAGKVAFDGALAFEMQSGNTYKIINPIDGGLSLTGTSANNYSLKFTDNVIATVYTEVAEDVTARLPDPLAINENGWVKVAAYPVVLTLPDIPAGFSFTDDNGSDPVTEFTISSDGEHVYYLKHSSMSAVFMHSLWTDATAPSIPATADEGSITTTTATFTLADATSGIASYTVTENGTEISAWPQLKAAVPGETSLVYTYTGRPGSSHTLTFEVTDMAGNTATSDVAFTLKSDYVPPVPSYYDIYLESSDSVRLSSGSTVVEEGYSFTFTAEVAEGYDPATLTVEYKRGRNGNWQALEAESNGKYRIRSVYDDIYVRAAVRPSGDPTAMDRVEDGKSRIRTLGNRICITADRPVDMRVVSIEGRVVRAERLPAGYSEVGGMPDGIYIVLLSDGTRSKVVIR